MTTKAESLKLGEFHTKSISDTVKYQYFESNGIKTGHGLTASNRWYPGVMVGNRFYYGLRQENKFLPGIIWGERFVPGLQTQQGFFPGLALRKNRFIPGIIALGAFIPGIIHGCNFVPGIFENQNFLPGTFTADRMFVPGRFLLGKFEPGVIQGNTFYSTNYEKITSKRAHILATKSYGITKIDFLCPVGGLPVNGIVMGSIYDRVICVPWGLLTNRGCVLGGLGSKQDLPVLDAEISLKNKMEDMGFDIETESDVERLFNRDDQIKEMMENFLDGGVFEAMGGGDSMWAGIDDFFDQLGQGENSAIDALNKSWSDYWNSVTAGILNSDGMISGNSGGHQMGGLLHGGVAGAMVGIYTEAFQGAKLGAYLGAAGAVVGGIAGGIAGSLFGAGAIKDGATYLGNVIYDGVVYLINWISGNSDNKNEEKTEKPEDEKSKKGGGTKTFDEPGGNSDTNSITQKPVKPLGPYISKKKTFIQIEQRYSNEAGVLNLGTSVVKIIQTDTGAMIIVDFDALKEWAKTHYDARPVFGLNPITGEAIYFPGDISSWTGTYSGYDTLPIWLKEIAHPDY